jgi:hypothetical protein
MKIKKARANISHAPPKNWAREALATELRTMANLLEQHCQ